MSRQLARNRKKTTNLIFLVHEGKYFYVQMSAKKQQNNFHSGTVLVVRGFPIILKRNLDSLKKTCKIEPALIN